MVLKILKQLEHDGVKIELAEGERLKTEGKLTDELRQAIRDHKRAIRAALILEQFIAEHEFVVIGWSTEDGMTHSHSVLPFNLEKMAAFVATLKEWRVVRNMRVLYRYPERILN